MKNKYIFSFVVIGLFFSFQVESAFAAAAACTGNNLILGVCEKTCSGTRTASGVCSSKHGSAYVAGDYSCCTTATAVSGNSQNNSSETTFTNPLTFDNIEALALNIMTAIQRTIVTFALVAMTIGALMYVLSSGVEATIEKAKKTISGALLGLAIAIAAPSMLKEVAQILGWTTDNATVTAAPSLSAISAKVLSFLLGIFGIISLIMMIIGAILYLTSAGDEDRIKKGKDIFKYSVLGVVIAMSAMVLVRQIASFFVA
ncbi:MAG: hypothetical protein HGA61_04475 [Candidatus Moranbacteria bacterium]|nr:hypothetical protein [Candidatus Moranbacteria bacterium]